MTPAHLVATLIEAAGSAILVGYVVAAIAALGRGHGPERSRLLLADGAVLSLGFKTGASLLKTLELGTWQQIGSFVAILALRTVLKQAFASERAGLLKLASGR